MLIRIVYCEKCDDMKLPKELIKWEGECPSCKKDAYKTAFWDTGDDIKSLLRGVK